MPNNPHPPRLATRILERLLPAGPTRDGLVGDLGELYLDRRARGHRLSADAWYLAEVLRAGVRYGRSGARRDQAARRHTGRELIGDFASAMRMAVRRLVRAPGFTAAASLTLMLGIGITLVVFAVLYSVVLRPLPFPAEDRLVVIEHPLPGFEINGQVPRLGGLLGQLLHYQEHSRTLVDVGGYWNFDAAITEEGDPEYVRIAGASGGFFRALGVNAARGHLFDGNEPLPTAEVRGRAILSKGLWQRRFGGDEAVLGRVLETQGFDYEIVGVLPPDMPFPPERAAVWNPIPTTRLENNAQWTVVRMVGRMAPGATVERVKAELDVLIGELPARFSQAEFRRAVEEGLMTAEVTPMKQWLVDDLARPLWLLLLAAFVVLGIAAVNVAGLVIVRAESYDREIAVRFALGARRGRIAGHFLAESAVLGILGGAMAVAMAAFTLPAAAGFAPPGIPRLESVRLGPETMALAAALVLASILFLAAAPSLLHGRLRPRGLAGRGRAMTGGRSRSRTHDLLVAAQVALSVTLLVGAGLVIRSAAALARVDKGFEADSVLTFRVPFPFQEIQSADPGSRATPFYDQLAGRLAALPGVSTVGYSNCLPLSPDCELGGTTLRRADRPLVEGALPVVGVVRVSPGYLEALGVPLRSGRWFEGSDHRNFAGVVLVNETLARRFWPEGDAIGGGIVQDGQPSWGTLEVVGIVGDIRFDDLRGEPEPIAYLPVLGPATPTDLATTSWVLRTEVPPASLTAAVRREVGALRADIPVASVATLAEVISAATMRLRLATWLLGIASIVAIALSSVGVYGIIAYVAGMRRRELGIRLALGARATELRWLIMRRGAGAVLAGLAIGVGGAIALSRLLQAFLFGVPSTDPPTYVAVVLILGCSAFLAALLPALRASRVDPATVLSTD